MSTVRILPDAAALAESAALRIVNQAQAALAERDVFSLVLSGGSTPRTLYARLAQKDLAGRVDWPRVHVFWGDERAVPPDDADSNYRMAKEALLDHVPIPPDNVHRIPAEMPPEAAAADYEGTLRAFFAKHCGGRFDMVLLGMGDDGHTASLFPSTDVLQEGRRWVVAHHVEKLDAWRITLTLVAINRARLAVFIVSGSGKAARLREVLYGPEHMQTLPAQMIRPPEGRLLWLVDEAAAGSL